MVKMNKKSGSENLSESDPEIGRMIANSGAIGALPKGEAADDNTSPPAPLTHVQRARIRTNTSETPPAPPPGVEVPYVKSGGNEGTSIRDETFGMEYKNRGR